jgi:heme iron utilization protein
VKDLMELKTLFDSQRLAVLATQSEGQPHGCLVAFACSRDLKHLFFSTDRGTRKYHDIHLNPRVAMLIDNRSNRESDFQQAVAVTARGTAWELEGKDREKWITLYLEKHPQLKDFTLNLNVALLKIDVDEFLVATFRSTYSIKP